MNNRYLITKYNLRLRLLNIWAKIKLMHKSMKVSGPEFKNNITDQLMVFKQDGDDWKIWTTAILNIEYID